ncbi:MAG: DUF6516 family protein [Desulfococcaceae bacterium]
MMNHLRTPEDYELFLYTLSDHFPSVCRSTLTFVRKGISLGRVAGELFFEHGIRLAVRERILWQRLPAVIDWYGYEIWHEKEKLYWYDSQPHPDDHTLRSTDPHHKHIPPDMKHNRIPAPNMRFTGENFTFLIREIENLIEKMQYKA